MKAAVLGENGVEVRDLPKPEPKPNEILIRVRATSLNRADLASPRAISTAASAASARGIGLECAGEVEAVGSAVKGFKAGDRVMAAAPGGYAEYIAADEHRATRIPANNMTYEQAACLPVAMQTMHNAIVTAGRFKAGETLLIVGASSGVGLMGLQIGKVMGASMVMGTSTNPGRRARLKEYGCDLALDTSRPEMAGAGQEGDRRQGRQPDRRHGVGTDGGAEASRRRPCSAASSMSAGSAGRRARSISTCMRSSASTISASPTAPARQDELNEVTRLMREDLWPAVEAGKLSLPIDKTFPLDKVADALAMMKANQHFGKIVLVM